MSGPTSLDDLISLITDSQDDDYRVGRTMSSFIVPERTLDSTVVNVALSNIAERPMTPNATYQPAVIEPGLYDISVVIHIRRISDVGSLIN